MVQEPVERVEFESVKRKAEDLHTLRSQDAAKMQAIERFQAEIPPQLDRLKKDVDKLAGDLAGRPEKADPIIALNAQVGDLIGLIGTLTGRIQELEAIDIPALLSMRDTIAMLSEVVSNQEAALASLSGQLEALKAEGAPS